MWDLPGPGLKPVSPALAGGFLTIMPPGKPQVNKCWWGKVLFYRWIPTNKSKRNDSVRLSSFYREVSPLEWGIHWVKGWWELDNGWIRLTAKRDTWPSHASWCHVTGRTHQVCSPTIKSGPSLASSSNYWLTGKTRIGKVLNPEHGKFYSTNVCGHLPGLP